MPYLQTFFYSPGGENETGNNTSMNVEDKKDSSAVTPEIKGEKDDKPVVEKIKEALQEWANKDQQDQEFDDTRV